MPMPSVVPSSSSSSPNVAPPLDSETFLPPRLSCIQDLRLIATSTRLYLVGRDPSTEPYNQRVQRTLQKTGIAPVSSSTGTPIVPSTTTTTGNPGQGVRSGHSKYAKYISGEALPSSSSTETSSAIPENDSSNYRYRILEFDRTIKEPSDLSEIMLERKTLYTETEIQSFLRTLVNHPSSAPSTHDTKFVSSSSSSTTSIASSSSSTPASSSTSLFKSFTSFLGGSGSTNNVSASPVTTPSPSSSFSIDNSVVTLDAVALLGAIQFMRGYYLILVTRRECIGTIGGHRIWGIRATELVPVYQENSSLNFLSSSTATATSATSSSNASANTNPSSSSSSANSRTAWQKMQDALNFGSTDPVTIAEGRYTSLFLSLDLTKDFYYSSTYDVTRPLQQQIVTRYAHAQDTAIPNSPDIYSKYIGKPTMKYVWNAHLVREFFHSADGTNAFLSSDWVTPLSHGFFRQVTVSVFGYSLLLTLIARRSRYYAGTRYLKRGVNDEGYVANDVESEQIVDDTYGRFASFVQIRGSIPLYWMQRTAIAVPKPPILLQPRDFTYEPARRHFAVLLSRYGGPVLLLNLVKKKERHAREKLIGSEWARTAMILNRELPSQLRLQYLALDYAAIVKNGRLNVLAALRDVGRWTMVNTGFFCNARLGDTLQARRERAIVSRRAKQVQGNIPNEADLRKGRNEKGTLAEGESTVPSESFPLNTHLQLPVGSISKESNLRIIDTETKQTSHTGNASTNISSKSSTSKAHLVYVAPGRIGESEPMKVSVVTDSNDGELSNVTVNTIMRSNNYQPPVPYIAALSALSAIPAVQIASSIELESAIHNYEHKRTHDYGNEPFRHSGSLTHTTAPNSKPLSSVDDRAKTTVDSSPHRGIAFVRIHPAVPTLKGIDFESVHADGEVDFNPLANIRTTGGTRTNPLTISKTDSVSTNDTDSSALIPTSETDTIVRRKVKHRSVTMQPSLHGGSDSPTKLADEELDNDSDTNDNGQNQVEDDDSSDSEGENSLDRNDPSSLGKSGSHRSTITDTDLGRQRSFSSVVGEKSVTVPTNDSFANSTVMNGTNPSRSLTASASVHTYTPLLHDTASVIPPPILVDSLPDLTTVHHRSTHDKHAPKKSGKAYTDIAAGGGGEKAVLILDSRKEGGSEGLLEAAGATEVELRTEAERPYGRTRDPSVAASAASRCRYVLSCSEQQDAVSSSNDGGALRVGIGVRLREYASVGGVGDYLYVDLQGRHHGYHTGITTRESSRSVYPHLLPSSIDNGPDTPPFGRPEYPAHIRYQEGVLRTNCIDCLDRTNVAQVCVGVHMLGLQLYALGLSDTEGLDPSGPLVRALMDLYEAHGDVIAMQYGGSEANKRVTSSAHEDSVRTGAATETTDHENAHANGNTNGSNPSRSTFTFFGSAASSAAAAVNISGTVSKLRLSSSGPAEILTSLQRYYSNSFTDSIKQASMNLFLGLWRPRIHAKEFHLWELETDNYLHNVTLTKTVDEIREREAEEEGEEEEENSAKKEGGIVPSQGWTRYVTDKDDPYTLNLKLAEPLQGKEWWNKPLTLFQRHGLPKYYGNRRDTEDTKPVGTDGWRIPRSTTLAYGGAALTEAIYARNEYTSMDTLVRESYAIVPQPGTWGGNVVTGVASVTVPVTTSVNHGKETGVPSNAGLSLSIDPNHKLSLPVTESKPKQSSRNLNKITTPSVLQNEAFGDSLFADILAKAVEVGQTITKETKTNIPSADAPKLANDPFNERTASSSLSTLIDKPKELANKFIDTTHHVMHLNPTQALLTATGIVRHKAEAIANYAMDTAEDVIGRAEVLRESVVDKATNALDVRVSSIVGVALDRVAAVTEAVRDTVMKANGGSDSPLISTDAPDVYRTLTNELIDPDRSSYSHYNSTTESMNANDRTGMIEKENRLQVYPESTSALDESFQDAILDRLTGKDKDGEMVEGNNDDFSLELSVDENANDTMGDGTTVGISLLRSSTKASPFVSRPSSSSLPVSYASLAEYPSSTEPYPIPSSSDASEGTVSGYVPDRILYESYAALGGFRGPSTPSPHTNPQQSSANRRIHVVTSKSDIDLFRTSVLLPGNGIANSLIIDNILQSGIGTMAELATFENKLSHPQASAVSLALSGTVPSLSVPFLGEYIPHGPFRGLPRGRLATPEIRNYLNRNETSRTALYTNYVHQNPLASSGTFYTNSKQLNNIGMYNGLLSGEKCDIPEVCAPLIIATGPLPMKGMESK